MQQQSHDLKLGRGSYGRYGRYGREGVTGEGSQIPASGHLIGVGSLLSSGGRHFPFKLTLHFSYGPMGETSLL